jgi:hypothetical protein
LSSGSTGSCSDVSTVGGVMTVIGVVGAIVSIWGFVKILNNDSDEARINRRIRELQPSPELGFDLKSRPGGGELALSLRF